MQWRTVFPELVKRPYGPIVSASMLAILIGLALLVQTTQSHAGESGVGHVRSQRLPEEVRVLVPAFDGPQPLGQQVATVLHLQIWQTLRSAPPPNSRPLTFGRGTVLWDPRPLADQSFGGAERLAKEQDAQVVLWGKAWRYGSDVVAQTFLSILRMERRFLRGVEPALWRVGLNVRGRDLDLEVGFPRWRYEFAPIVLAPEVVERFSLPSALHMTSERSGGARLGTLGASFRALRQEGDFALVESESRTGWVHLPELSRNRSEVVDFTGGVVRMMRGDWEGAYELLQRVVENSRTPASLRIDSLILQGVAREQSGLDGCREIEYAYALNPYSRSTATYYLMKRVSTLARAIQGTSRARFEAQLKLEDTLHSTRYMFGADDPWIRQVERVLSYL